MGAKKEVVVVGAGLAGLSAAMRLCEQGCHVKLVSVTKAKRSHSVCAQGGINAALNLQNEGDTPFNHAYDTIKGGDFLANQPPILEMAFAGPSIIQMFDRLGCPFNRKADGSLEARRFGGTLFNRTVFCGASTGQQLLYALDEQVRKFEVGAQVERFENHEFFRLIRDAEGFSRGVVILNLFTTRFEVLKGDAVVFATGGPGLLFKKSTNSIFCTGAANARLYKQGMCYANGEFIQIHPTAIPGQDKLRLITETARGEGGRLWVTGDEKKTIVAPDGKTIPCGKTGEPWYFLEEMYPGYGNLVSRDVASREILRVCELGLGIDGGMQVYLDITHLPEFKKHRLESALDIYKKFTGDDPRVVPMKIFPAVHYSMGGAWVDWPAADDPDRMSRFRQMTNLPGCFNCGESDYQFHGANRLGGNSLLSCVFGGLVCGDEVPRYLETLKKSFREVPEAIFKEALEIEENEKRKMFSQEKGENVYLLFEELSDLMIRNVTVKRNNGDLAMTLEKLKQIRDRSQQIALDDKGGFANQNFQFAAQFQAMCELALVITKGALLRDEFRGSHFKPEFPKRDDENWLKTTLAFYEKEEPRITYEKVDTRHVAPQKRDYTKADKSIPEFKNVPAHLREMS